MTLSAAPSLETLHGTHGSKTKHERKGSESVRQKNMTCKKTNKCNVVCTQGVGSVGRVGMAMMCVCLMK